MRNLALKIGLALSAITIPQWLIASDAHTPPWRNVVSADDSAVFSVLVVLAIFLLIMIGILAKVTSTLASDKKIWGGKGKSGAGVVMALLGVSTLFPASANANGLESMMLFVMTDSVFWLLLGLCFFLALIAFALLFNLKSMMSEFAQEDENFKPATGSFEAELIGLRPIEEEKDLLLDHEYDGIMELDNNLPPWWLYMFYATIIFGFIYIPYYHFGAGGELPEQEYKSTMANANLEKEERLAKMANSVDENSVILLSDASAISAGEKTFNTYCVACHNKGGAGSPTSVGPNLTDQFWIHGGGIKNVFKTIKYGVPQKGMISWETQLNPVQMQQVASYIIGLAGTDNGTGKDPQGDEWTGGDELVSGDGEETAEAAVEEGVEETAELKDYELLTDAASLESGKMVYDAMCMACHGIDGGGSVGPNFTDEYWIHGGDMAHIMELIRVGNPAKGMISWEATLTEEQRQQVASYILTFQGTSPATPKAAEGEKWEN